MTYAVGSLLQARGREWVVQPEVDPDLLILRPLGGTDDVGIGKTTEAGLVAREFLDRGEVLS